MCGSGPKWKRENVADHKFDFINVEEFTDKGFFMRLKYLWLYLIVLKSFLVYVSDIFSAITMLTTKNWSNQIFQNCGDLDGCIAIPFDVGKWLFVGCIIFSFLLLAYETRKTKKIIASRDISYAFTNVMANNYYSLRSYDCFCFFDHISNSTKTSDDFAFFVFFIFKDWKRLMLADVPRQTINALTLYAVYLSKKGDHRSWYDVSKYFDGNKMSTSALIITTAFTVTICAGSLLLLGVAGLCYIPLLCHIRGNLKEYCCHIVDKRIGEIIERKRKERLASAAKEAEREARGDFSHLKNKKGELVAKPLAQPTLPKLMLDDDETSSVHTRVAPSTYTQDSYYYHSDKGAHDLPPMPAYNPYSTHQPPGNYPQFNPSFASAHDPHPQYMYDDDNESTTHLAAAAAPFARADPVDRQNSPYRLPGSNYDPYSRQGTPLQGQQPPRGPPHHRSPPGSVAPSAGYDDAMSDYYGASQPYANDSRQGYAGQTQYGQGQNNGYGGPGRGGY